MGRLCNTTARPRARRAAPPRCAWTEDPHVWRFVVELATRRKAFLLVALAMGLPACRAHEPVAPRAAEAARPSEVAPAFPSRARLEALRRYIHATWQPLTRSLATLP